MNSDAASVTYSLDIATGKVTEVRSPIVITLGWPMDPPRITGILRVNETLGVSGSGWASYQWLADGEPISGATASTYFLTIDEVGKMVSVTVGLALGGTATTGALGPVAPGPLLVLASPESYLHTSNWLSADQVQVDGIYWFRYYDLLAMGSEGAAVAASTGYRYVSVFSSDHFADVTGGWYDGFGVWLGFSNDPGNPPADIRRVVGYDGTFASTPAVSGKHAQLETPYLVYNPDDASTPFYLYVHGSTVSDAGRGQETVLYRSADFSTFTAHRVTHYTTNNAGHVGYQTVIRNGTGDWVSYGLVGVANNPGIPGRFLSTDGVTFTYDQTYTNDVSNRRVDLGSGSPIVTISGQRYSVSREDNRAGGGAMWVSLVPIDADGDTITGFPGNITRLNNSMAGTFPGPTYLQTVLGYEESGVLLVWALRGYFEEEPPYAAEFNEWIDLYSIVTDPALAAQSAPFSLTATSAAGSVSLAWKHGMSGRTFKVYHSTTSATAGFSALGTTTDLSYTHNAPTANARNWYKIVTMEGATERDSRVVAVYSSAYRALTNKHILRVIEAGGTGYDAAYIDTVAGFLETNNLTNDVLYFADVKFGYLLDGSSNLDVTYCLGATINPWRGGDLVTGESLGAGRFSAATPQARTYSATGINSTPASMSGGNTRAWLMPMYPRLNQLRRLTAITAGGAYSRPTINPVCLFQWGGNVFRSNYLFQPYSTNSISLRSYNGGSVETDLTVATPASGPIVAIGRWNENTDTKSLSVNGTTGTGSMVGSDAYKGTIGGNTNSATITIGEKSGYYQYSTDQFAFGDSSADFNAASLFAFKVDIGATATVALDALLKARVGI